MRGMTENEMRVLLELFKRPKREFNAHNLSGELGLSHPGTMKILKGLEGLGVLGSRRMGRATFYSVKLSDGLARAMVELGLKMESRLAGAEVRRWVRELKRLGKAGEIGVLFGSVLRGGEFRDVDLLWAGKAERLEEVEREVEKLNKINAKRIHLVRQTPADLTENIQKGNDVVLDAIGEGVVAFGERELIEVMKDARKRDAGEDMFGEG